MVREADEFRGEDENNKSRVEAKNSLENYAYSLRNTLRDEKVTDKILPADKEVLSRAVDATLKWVDANQAAEKDELEAKQKELEGVAVPIMTKMYQQGTGMPAEPASGADESRRQESSPSENPKIEEVD